jgi:hypothetical protein
MTCARTARIYLFPKGHAGRENDFSGAAARLGIVFPQDPSGLQFGCGIRSVDGSKIVLGRFIDCEVTIMNPADSREYLAGSHDFRLYEGARLIGVGIWTEGPMAR